MDDLSSLDWNASKSAPIGQESSAPKGNYYPTLRPTPPLSGRSTPNLPPPQSFTQKAVSNAPTGSRGSTPANDSFANLVSFNAAQPMRNLSLQEQQQRLQEEKARQELERKKAIDSHLGVQALNTLSWNNLGDGRSTPNRLTGPPTYTATSEYGGHSLSKVINKPFADIPPPSHTPSPHLTTESDDDNLAAFNASAPVDKSSHMPAPLHSTSFDSNANGVAPTVSTAGGTTNGFHAEGAADDDDDVDDPFGLGMALPRPNHSQSNSAYGNKSAPLDDDVLGMLGRPVSEFPNQGSKEEESSKPENPKVKTPKVRALNELVDMGFEPAKCTMALESTESGTDVQAAVAWLLNRAHEESKMKNKHSRTVGGDRDGGKNGPHPGRAPARRTSSNEAGSKPAWMKGQGTGQRRQDSKSPVKSEKDPAQYASELGSSLFKTANSLWKTGQKKLNQAVAEFNAADGVDPSQPKWMKESSPDTVTHRSRMQQHESDPKDEKRVSGQHSPQAKRKPAPPEVTDEALLLEGGARPPPRKTAAQPQSEPIQKALEPFGDRPSQKVSKQREEVLPRPKFMQQATNEPRSKLSRQAVEDEAAAAYISPARRKRTAQNPRPVEPEPAPEPDLLLGDDESRESRGRLPLNPPSSVSPQARPTPSKPLPVRPPQPKRAIPPLSSIALQSATVSRKAGTEAFKRGDYARATQEYNQALGNLPQTHPLTIVVLTNRSLSHSKTGDPKASIADATTTLDLIGPSRGVGESIDFGTDEGLKPMDGYWGKAMQRKAEGLEHLERWADAAAAWRSCVEAGVGGATSITSRNRCENAARPKPPPAPKKVPPRPKPSALGDLAPDSVQSAEAVNRLRAANVAADKLDDEKFRLADIVDDRVSRWRAGKEGNLRALLASLESVLWEDAGWKKTSMGELIQTNKVKIVYMRGISKVHPDKV